jgi:hypothetical protein
MADGASEGSCDPSAWACGQESLSKSRFGLTRDHATCLWCHAARLHGLWLHLAADKGAADWPSEVACAPSGQ